MRCAFNHYYSGKINLKKSKYYEDIFQYFTQFLIKLNFVNSRCRVCIIICIDNETITIVCFHIFQLLYY